MLVLYLIGSIFSIAICQQYRYVLFYEKYILLLTNPNKDLPSLHYRWYPFTVDGQLPLSTLTYIL
jgi:hypothetical protein